MRNKTVLTIAAPLLAVALAAAISTLVLIVSGNSPVEIFRLLGDQLTSKNELIKTVNRAGPYYVSAVAVAIGFKMMLFNIGVEGQYRLAALVGAAAGASLPLPGFTRLIGILVVASLVGAAWAGIAGALRAYRGVSEVIATIMLNSIALGVIPFMLTRWFKAEKTGVVDYSVKTEQIPGGGRLPRLDWLVPGDLGSGVHLSSYLLIAAAVGAAYYVIVWRTRFGYDLRASGGNANAARASGVDPKRMILTAMLLSGAAAGLVGLAGVLSGPGYAYSDEAVIGGLGFTGIAIALLGRNNPVGIVFGALLWAFMDIAQTPMSRAELPKEIVTIMQGIIVLSVVVAYEVVRRVGQRMEAASLSHDGSPAPPPGPAPATQGAPA